MICFRSSSSFQFSRLLPKILPSYRRYVMAPTPVPVDRRPIVLSGPSGVGKGTLYKMLLDRHPDTFATSISHTTRSPRPGEVHGQDYYYVSMQEFEDLIAQRGFLEHAKFGNNRYGSSKRMIEEMGQKGKVVILDIEMEGVKQVKQAGLDARYVFIEPPSFEALESRLRGRGTEKEGSIQMRLQQARLEVDYSKKENVHDTIIVNDDKEKAYGELEAFIFGKETVKTQEQPAKDGQFAGESVID